MKLIASNKGDLRSHYIFEKDVTFFTLFPRFLLGCGFKDLGVYEEYGDIVPDIMLFKNKIENFKNDEYDLDVIITSSKIMLIIRTVEANKDNVVSGINLMTS